MKESIGHKIARHRVLILIFATILLGFSALGYIKTGINYDLLEYLPQNLDSTIGQNILDKKFSNAATSMFIIENKTDKEIQSLKEKIQKVEGVEKVIWRDDIFDINIPRDILPDSVNEIFFSNNSTMLIVKFKESSSSSMTMNSVDKIRQIGGAEGFLSGITPVVKDTKDLIDIETPKYIVLAIVLSTIVLIATNESTLIPLFFLINIGYAVIYNLGSNVIFGEISYITKAIAAVLQLAVTMDYSIFLYHSYTDQRKIYKKDHIYAMGIAIDKTISSIFGSSFTTFAGFLALIAMELSLGKDIGFVMAKGVVFGLITAITILPSLILVADKYIYKFQHKLLLPEFIKSSNFIVKHNKFLLVVFILLFVPAIYGNMKAPVYYNLDRSLPDTLPSIVANKKLKENFNMQSSHFLILKDNLKVKDYEEIINKIESIEGVENVLAIDKFLGPMIPKSFIPKEASESFIKNGYEMIMINSKYSIATDDVSNQMDKIIEIAKSYDKNAKLTGEAALTRDLTLIADSDFKKVNIFSIVLVFFIIMLLYKSLILPVLLILAIELAIFINMGFGFYTNTPIPFVASIIIGTVQLGSTIDYSILLSMKFFDELKENKDKYTAIKDTLISVSRPIVTSAISFIAATIGVGVYSDMDIVSSICIMMARGAFISMLVIIVLLPSIILFFYKPLIYTTKSLDFLRKGDKKIEK
ncbi:MAG: efflux RND transporter permease subunit [Peptoniphilaceae bacterium]